MATTSPSDQIKVYRPRQTRVWGYGLIAIVVGSVAGFVAWNRILAWRGGGPAPDFRIFAGLFGPLLVLAGLLGIVNLLRGFPRLTVTSRGLSFDQGYGPRSANWDSLGPLEVKILSENIFGRQTLAGTAPMVAPDNPNAAENSFEIPDYFDTPIGIMVTELNVMRTEALDASRAADTAPRIDRP